MAITIKSEREIELMAEAGKILERVHNELEKALHPGMSTKDIDTLGEKIIRSYGCIPSEEAKKLIQVTKECFFEGIKYAKAGNHLFDISGAIGRYAEERGYGVVRDLCGHGIGTALHEAPEIPNYEVGRKGVKLRPGMTLAIEPMINIGTYEVDWLDDDWTVVTRDGSLSAHYENTILITEGEPRILSLTCDNE